MENNPLDLPPAGFCYIVNCLIFCFFNIQRIHGMGKLNRNNGFFERKAAVSYIIKIGVKRVALLLYVNILKIKNCMAY